MTTNKRRDVAHSRPVHMAEASPPIGQTTGAVAAAIALEERLGHVIEKNAAAGAALGRNHRQHVVDRFDWQIGRDPLPEKQCPYRGRVASRSQGIPEIIVLEVDRYGDWRRWSLDADQPFRTSRQHLRP